MRIAVVATSHVPSIFANSIQVMKVCNALATLSGPVSLWVPGNTHTPWTEMAPMYGLDEPFEVNWIPSNPKLKRYDFSIAAFQRARKWKADIIYSFLPQVSVLSGMAQIPTILEMHNLPTGKLGPWLFRQFVGLRSKKRLLVITDALRQTLERLYRVSLPDTFTRIAPNGIDLKRYEGLPAAAEARRRLGYRDQVTAVYSGHFYPGRGMDVLYGLAKAFPQVQFIWAGGLPEAVAEWQTRISQDGVQNIILTGFIPNQDLPLVQAAGDFLLMPYGKEILGSSGTVSSASYCSPMKMFDYMAAGRLILTSDLPVIHEVLNENNAVFCEPDQLVDWINSFSALLADPARCEKLSSQAKQDVRRYDWKARAERALEGWQ